MSKLIKTSSEVQAQDFSKALGEALARVEKRPKKKRKKKNSKELARRALADDFIMIHNSAFDPLVTTGRTDASKPNIANPPRKGTAARWSADDNTLRVTVASGTEMKFDLGERNDGSAPDDRDVMSEFPMSTAVERLIDNEADKTALAERKVASGGMTTGFFMDASNLTWSMSVIGKKVL